MSIELSNILTVGDTLDFTAQVTDYPPSDGWTLKYRLVPRVAGTIISITATTDVEDYVIQVDAGTTETWATGYYTWSAYVEKVLERYTVGRGQLQIRPSSVAMTAGTDGRTAAQQGYDAINAVLLNRATIDQQEYTIGGRQLKRMTISDLLLLRDRYAAMLRQETAAERVAAGLQNPKMIGTRFQRI